MGSKTKPIGAVDRSFEIIEKLEELEEAGLSEIADELSLSRSTAYTHLNTLHASGYLVKDDGLYRLSCHFLRIGAKVQKKFPLYRYGKTDVNKLAEKTGERANLVIEEQGKGTCIHAADANDSTNVAMARGEQIHIHASATGKALLARLPNKRVNEIVRRHGLPKFTEQTITSYEDLKAEMADIRETGISIDNEENVEGLRCIASPIVVENEALGSISVSGPSHQFSDQDRMEELKESVRETANVIQLNFVFR